jgi:alkylation response protein AidB-like acyl-CoA dehydrogenase
MRLTPDQQQIEDMARRFAVERVAPHAAEWERDRRIPPAIVRQMGALGLLGMCIPPEHGGSGVDHVSYVVAIEEIAAAHGALSTLMSVQNSLVLMPLAMHGTAGQKARFIGPVARGEMLGCFGLTEPQAGSDASSLRTVARREAGGYRISGAKQFITNGRDAGLAIVFAVTDPEKRAKGISAFIVPTDTPGFRIVKVEDKLGQHASDTAALGFEDMFIPEELRLGEEGGGYRIALSNLEMGRMGIAAQAVGMARAALDVAVAYARERTAFGKPIAEHQAVAFRLADMATEIEAARQLVRHAAALRDEGAPCLKEASMAKLFASEMAERVCSAAVQTLGGYGYVTDFPVERFLRDVRVCQIYEGTSDIQRMIIARQVLGSA